MSDRRVNRSAQSKASPVSTASWASRHGSDILIVLVLAAVSAAGAMISARITFGADGWLWNLDLPKIHYPMALFYHEALTAGRLPLWEANLGLGFPLYAEGQIGAFYPPHWVAFQVEPLLALDLVRLGHLTFAGVGAGLIGLRVSGSRYGALLAALIVVMSGAIVTKLEWWNVVAAYAWMPWVLLPLVGRRAPRRAEVAIAGVLWGVQALTGHPNTWLLTGAAAAFLLVRRPLLASLGRVVVFGVIGVGVGALQLIPTEMIRRLSGRAEGLDAQDLFTNTATPFDLVSVGFVNTFLRSTPDGWDYGTSWFPDGRFPILEAGIYLGLPVLALAGLSVPARRARRWLWLAVVAALVAIVAAFRPDVWTDIPIVNGLRAPVRAYLVLSLAVAILAAVGVSRLGRTPKGVVWGLAAMTIPIVAYMLLTAVVFIAPPIFIALHAFASNEPTEETLAAALGLARQALVSPWPFVAELALGFATAVLLVRPRSVITVIGAVALAVAPLALFMPAANLVRGEDAFSFADSPIAVAIAAEHPHRVLTIDRPAGGDAFPNRLAAAGIPDIEMFSSLNLGHVNQAVINLRRNDPDGVLRRALGIDVLVRFGEECDGRPASYVEDNDAYVCRADDPAVTPYWLPSSAAGVVDGDGELPSVRLDLAEAVEDAVPATRSESSPLRDHWTIDAPAEGWFLIDRAWWPSWEVTVDGQPVTVHETWGSQIVRVPAGRHEIEAALVPREVGLGALVGVGALAFGIGWVAWPRFRDRRNRVNEPATARC